MTTFNHITEKYVFGGISGMVGAVVTHPIDTIKSNIQNGTKINIRHLYRGISAPLLGVGIEKSIVFGTYNLINSKFDDPTSNLAIGVSGGVSGISASIIVTPCERIKILLQTNNKNFKTQIKPTDFFRGLSATFTREIPGFAIYFLTFENLKSLYFPNGNINKKCAFLFGGISGALSWVFIYPQDLIKTRIQACTKNKKMSFVSTGNMIIKNDGIKGLYKGFHLALLRAVPLHAFTFATMQTLLSSWKNI